MVEPNDTSSCLTVGVGASAGGLEPLVHLLQAAKPGSDLCVVIALHLAPDYPSLMAQLLSAQTRLRVVPADSNMRLQADTAYVIQPQTYLTLEGRNLVVTKAARHTRNPIDRLFHSMASTLGSDCAAIVLSGTGSDGAEGITAVKESGGITIAQRPETARFDGMPIAALATGNVDLMLAPDEMLPELRAIHLDSEDADEGGRETILALGSIFAAIRVHTGVDFSHYKLTTAARRVERRRVQLKLPTLEAYAKLVRQDPSEAAAVKRDLLIGVTEFMRDADAIVAFRTLALPRLIAVEGDAPLRVWVAGCSTGQEAYSIAMLLAEALEQNGSGRGFKLFATDIDEAAIEHASAGCYSEEELASLPKGLRDRHFRRQGDTFIVNKSLREHLLFSRHNVITDATFPRLHAITCRNLLIYLKPLAQTRVIEAMSHALLDEGLLWLGSSESLGPIESHFDVLDARWKLFSARSERPRTRRRESRVLRPIEESRGDRRKQDQIVEAAEVLLGEYMPPTLITDENLRLLYSYGTTTDILRMPTGSTSLEVRDLAPAQIALLVSTAAGRLRSSDDQALYRGLVAELRDGTRREFDLRARPLKTAHGRLFAFTFERFQAPSEERSSAPTEAPASTLDALERELRDSRLNLQVAVEDLESSNEELQATNEELVASNEELQSTNEELQSVNEELHTVNAEHAQRLDDLTRITEDLDQLLSTLDVGIVFLDIDLCIRRFNEQATRHFNVLAQDVGRPIAHLTHQLDYPGLLDDCAHVLGEHQPVSHRISAQAGDELRVTITPFHATTGEPRGLVLSIAE